MQPIEKSLYQPWLAARANGKIAPVRNFLYKLFVQVQWFLYSISFFITFSFSTAVIAKFSCNSLVSN